MSAVIVLPCRPEGSGKLWPFHLTMMLCLDSLRLWPLAHLSSMRSTSLRAIALGILLTLEPGGDLEIVGGHVQTGAKRLLGSRVLIGIPGHKLNPDPEIAIGILAANAV